jgi:DNA-binding NtrC family response regulator/tetratricopeptide (TPR) repeat protein
MDPLDSAKQFRDGGQYRHALEILASSNGRHERAPWAALKAEVLERSGLTSQAQQLAEQVLKTKDTTLADRATCEDVVGKVLAEHGDVEGALERFQRSAYLARESGDLRRLCWSQISLLVLVADRSGPEAASPLLLDARRTAIKLGDPRATAALHLHVGELEAKRGLFDGALRHISIGQKLLHGFPNLWLDAFGENVKLAIGILRSDFLTAQLHGLRAAELGEQSGVASISRSALANLGYWFYATGDFEKAFDHFDRSEKQLPTSGEKTNARIDSFAKMLLAQNRLEECAALLDTIDRSIRSPKDRVLSGNRSSELTRAQLWARLGRTSDAIAKVGFVLNLAEQAGDTYLAGNASLAMAELLTEANRPSEAIALVNASIHSRLALSPELYARSERILASALAKASRYSAAGMHYERARRICTAVQSVPELLEAERCWLIVADRPQGPSLTTPRKTAAAENGPGEELKRTVVHSAAAAVLYPDRPELVARELLELLRTTDCVHSAAVVARAADGTEAVLAEIAAGCSSNDDDAAPPRRLSVGFAHDRTIDLVVQPKPDIESAATVNAVTLLLSTVHNLERARLEREERATLWPIEELPIEGEHAVIAGHMRERMNLARRVAPAKVIVLVTGESGTGKEILARAVHDYSERASKPFVAFNCAAIPRDLLESQLFGHRRGAFTGADRDHTGVIRSARDGTLFLDEIGELSLDLQPKLLRFLESGEIAPLGEPPTTVNVRLVAATNSSLEEAVRAGKFREDLFYRLNVVRLSLKPLRERRDEIAGLAQYFVSRAALEYHKGNMRISDETIERLLLYRWPGNIRQLQNEVRRMVALAEPDSTLEPDAIDEDILGALPLRSTLNGTEMAISLHDKLTPTLARIECEMIKAALSRHRGKVDVVAKALGISRKGLYLKRQRLGL